MLLVAHSFSLVRRERERKREKDGGDMKDSMDGCIDLIHVGRRIIYEKYILYSILPP